ncbi:type VI secretion system contractile sheath small subunit [Photorhabdus heterorhabditis]|uniref:type VI secretion system contractile sheath small subunit n=1 Tax=Photorhabdus heterorhabditis TaxID=880156 RepID=UPI0020B77AAD|nr:type VI secretion system contractile sheath small subunit [Photorhabdus heterorhabditis]
MAASFQNEVPKARINIKLDLHTGGAQKKVELPLKLLVMGDYSNRQEQRPLSEREKVNINKNNFDSVLTEFSPAVNLIVENTLAEDGNEMNIDLTFRQIKDFEPEQVARQIPQLRALLSPQTNHFNPRGRAHFEQKITDELQPCGNYGKTAYSSNVT